MSKYVCFPSIFTFPISHFLPYSFPIILIVIGTAARRKSVFLEPRIGPGPSPRPPIPSIRVVYGIATPHYKFNHCILALYFMLFLSFKYILFSEFLTYLFRFVFANCSPPLGANLRLGMCVGRCEAIRYIMLPSWYQHDQDHDESWYHHDTIMIKIMLHHATIMIQSW